MGWEREGDNLTALRNGAKHIVFIYATSNAEDATVGSADVEVARLRSDTSASDPDRSLQMWLSADPIRQAAENAVALMRARLSVH